MTNTKGIATHKIHIKGTMIKSLFSRTKLSIKNSAKVATNSLPTTAAGTKFLDFAERIVTAPTASPIAVINPKISPWRYFRIYNSYWTCCWSGNNPFSKI